MYPGVTKSIGCLLVEIQGTGHTNGETHYCILYTSGENWSLSSTRLCLRSSVIHECRVVFRVNCTKTKTKNS